MFKEQILPVPHSGLLLKELDASMQRDQPKLIPGKAWN